jgi:hypothetical protein
MSQKRYHYMEVEKDEMMQAEDSQGCHVLGIYKRKAKNNHLGSN